MTIEAAAFVSQLNAALPPVGDPLSEGDDHIRLVKTTLVGSIGSLGAAALTVTAAQVNSIPNLANKTGQAYTGTHNFTGATVAVTTAPVADSSTLPASTEFVQANVAAVNATGTLSLAINALAAFTLSVGQHVIQTAVSLTTATLPATPSAGQMVALSITNGRIDNVMARNGLNIMGLAQDMTIDNANATVTLRYVDATYGWRLI